MRLSRCALAAAALISSAPAGAAPTVPAALGLHAAACVQGRSRVPALCGTYGVYENRRRRSGRVISLRLVVLRAIHPEHRAIAFIAGGPGQSATAFAPLVADGTAVKELSSLRDRYDILFVDNRGMGGSHAFGCELAPVANPRAYFKQLWPDGLVSRCRANSAATSTLRFYNTDNAVDDLDEVRAALGYPKIVLEGGSYGTFFAFVFVRRHAKHVESAVLNGVYAPHFQPLPGAPEDAQHALDDLIARCRRDGVCASHFPRFAEHFAALVRRLDRGPIPVVVSTGRTGHVQTVLLSKEVFADEFRQMLDDPANAAYLPAIVEHAYRGDTVPLGAMVNAVARGLAHGLDWGAFLSYTCADEIPFLSEEKLRAAAQTSFAADLRARAQQRACRLWNVPPMPSSFDEPVRSSLPMLLISGSDDPATPPRYAARALRYLRNAKQVLVRGAGHAADLPCTERLVVAFVRAGSARRLDVSRCSADFTPPPFAISP